MVLFNYTTRELTAKIVYYGPGLCGKTTNLQFIYDGLPAQVKKGKMLSLATKTDRTLFFDFLPIELGRIRGMRTRVQLYTVPGQVFYNSTRKLVLKGADGVVFVADSQQKMMESNVESYRNLEENLGEIGLKLDEIPLVMQFNKRDLPNLSSVEEMNTLINRHNAPFYEAVATTGIGVEDTLKAITKLVLNHLAAKYRLGTAEEGKSERAPATISAGIASIREELEPSHAASVPSRASIPEPAAALAAPAEYEVESSLLDELDSSPSIDSPQRASAQTDAEDLDVLDLDEEESAAPAALAMPEHDQPVSELSEDLSDLLEEIPEEADESPLGGLRDAPALRPALSPRAVESPLMAAARPVSRPAEAVRPGVQPAARVTSEISADPLGILAARQGEVSTPAIHLGDVTPGRQHQVTVPLEMSVDGRKVRLQLKMTVTLSL
jgi:signal recognition particle receptor subunit beta